MSEWRRGAMRDRWAERGEARPVACRWTCRCRSLLPLPSYAHAPLATIDSLRTLQCVRASCLWLTRSGCECDDCTRGDRSRQPFPSLLSACDAASRLASLSDPLAAARIHSHICTLIHLARARSHTFRSPSSVSGRVPPAPCRKPIRSARRPSAPYSTRTRPSQRQARRVSSSTSSLTNSRLSRQRQRLRMRRLSLQMVPQRRPKRNLCRDRGWALRQPPPPTAMIRPPRTNLRLCDPSSCARQSLSLLLPRPWMRSSSQSPSRARSRPQLLPLSPPSRQAAWLRPPPALPLCPLLPPLPLEPPPTLMQIRSVQVQKCAHSILMRPSPKRLQRSSL